MSPAAETAFYSVSDERFFLGAVGLINSLRLVGHSEPIYLLDLGLTDSQRELLEPHVELVAAPGGVQPWLAKTIAPLAHPAEVMVLIDADMIVTRPLDELIDQAAGGRVVAVEHGSDRFFAEWGEALDLGALGRRPYVCSGLVLAGGALGAEVVALLDERQRRVDVERTWFVDRDLDYPFAFPEQDVLNAILASDRVDDERLVVIDRRLEPIPPFSGLRVLDERTLRCAYEDGVEPFLLHHYAVKPWLELTVDGVYSRLLRRLLLGGDVLIRVRRSSLPRQLRSGFLAEAVRNRARGRSRFDAYVREPLIARVCGLRDRDRAA
jgi:hypothetical protein